MLALTLVTFISFVDDVKSISQLTRLFFHFSAMALMFYQWGLFSLSWWWLVLALIVCTGIINAYNFMDGINGITGGYSLVVLAALAYINQEIVPFVEKDFYLYGYLFRACLLLFQFPQEGGMLCGRCRCGKYCLHRSLPDRETGHPYRRFQLDGSIGCLWSG